MPSSFNNIFLTPNPAENPPIEPFEAMTRWQGMIIGTGFAPQAFAAARTAFGLPVARASHA